MVENSSQNHAGCFQTTRWSVVLGCLHEDREQSRRALDQLCRAYWQPIYVYVRSREHSMHDAEDLTQEFIADLLDREALKHIEPSKGKFRAFLLASLKNFLNNKRAESQAIKRGGGRAHLTLDFPGAESLYKSDAVMARSPEQLYERQWALMAIDRARARLREEYRAAGKGDRFETLIGFLPGEPRAMTQQEAADHLASTLSSVKSEVYRMKKRFGRHLRAEIAETVQESGEIEEELRHLLEVVSR